MANTSAVGDTDKADSMEEKRQCGKDMRRGIGKPGTQHGIKVVASRCAGSRVCVHGLSPSVNVQPMVHA